MYDDMARPASAGPLDGRVSAELARREYSNGGEDLAGVLCDEINERLKLSKGTFGHQRPAQPGPVPLAKEAQAEVATSARPGQWLSGLDRRLWQEAICEDVVRRECSARYGDVLVDEVHRAHQLVV